jgi:hypothetical protein
MSLLGHMGFDLKWLRTGVYVAADTAGKLPVKGQVIVDPADSKLTLKIEPPTEVLTLVPILLPLLAN